jgi:hypothetical protein
LIIIITIYKNLKPNFNPKRKKKFLVLGFTLSCISMFDLIKTEVILSKIKTKETACKKWYQRYKNLVSIKKGDYDTYSAYYDAISSEEMQKIGVRVVDRTKYIFLDHNQNSGEETIFEDAEEAYKCWYDEYIANRSWAGELEKKITDFDSFRDFYMWYEDEECMDNMGTISEV